MIFIAPRLLPMLEMTIHQTSDDEIRKITIIDKITLYMSSVLMFVVAFIMFIMFYEVVMRYFFSKPTLWVEELSRWMGGVIFLLAGNSGLTFVWLLFMTWSRVRYSVSLI
jgi:TRAP-type C4-dicarboxylate transport system permease small subunit